jgi:hypothetical protein
MNEEGFWKRVNKNGPIITTELGPCWIWTGSKNKKSGYGNGRFNGEWDYVHRFSWKLHYGSIPERMLVCHKCDNPPCIRPDHLFLGNPLINAEDRDKKLRGRRKYFTKEEQREANKNKCRRYYYKHHNKNRNEYMKAYMKQFYKKHRQEMIGKSLKRYYDKKQK